jgi:hypothetical protein
VTDTHTPDHDATTCPGCRELEEYRVTADVYGCPAGRRCTQATPEQRAEFDRQIAKRLTARRQNSPEKS